MDCWQPDSVGVSLGRVLSALRTNSWRLRRLGLRFGPNLASSHLVELFQHFHGHFRRELVFGHELVERLHQALSDLRLSVELVAHPSSVRLPPVSPFPPPKPSISTLGTTFVSFFPSDAPSAALACRPNVQVVVTNCWLRVGFPFPQPSNPRPANRYLCGKIAMYRSILNRRDRDGRDRPTVQGSCAGRSRCEISIHEGKISMDGGEGCRFEFVRHGR